MKLTKARIERATYEGRRYVGKDGRERFSRYVVWDSEIPGFGLRVTPAGHKSFVLSYRVHGRKKLMKLGVFGQITLAQARKKARRELGTIADGGDPLKARREKRAKDASSMTMTELVDLYKELHLPKLKPSTRKGYRVALNQDILPALGNRRVDSIQQQDVARLHLARRSTPGAANTTLTVLSGLFTLAQAHGLREQGSNPCRGVKRFRQNNRERFLSFEEIERLGQALDVVEQDKSVHPSSILAIRLLLLTGARKSEILNLRWEEVSFERRCLRLMDSKTGEKTILLSAPALELLSKAPRVEGNPHVCFGEVEGQPFKNLYHGWMRVCELAELEDVRIHDLRHSFASVGAIGGWSLPMIGALLGHRKAETTARYAHLSESPVHEAAEAISGQIAAALRLPTGQESQGDEEPSEDEQEGREGRPGRP